MDPLQPNNNGTGVALACTDASGSTRVALTGEGDSLMVTNVGSSTGYLAIGDSTVTALAPGSTASYPVLPGTKEDQLLIEPTASYAKAPYVAGVCKSGETTTLVIHRVSR